MRAGGCGSLHVVITVVFSVTNAVAQSSSDAFRKLNLDATVEAAIRYPDYEILVSPGRLGDLELGDGFDMRDPLFPKRQPLSPFTKKQKASLDAENVSLSVMYLEESFAEHVKKEARFLSAYFSAKFFLGSAKASIEKAQEVLSSEKVAYVQLIYEGPTSKIDGAKLKLSGKLKSDDPMGDSTIERDKSALLAFLESYGSHFVSEIDYGGLIVFRATTTQTDESSTDKMAASLRSAALGVKGGAQLEQTHKDTLIANNASLQIVSGGIVRPDKDTLNIDVAQVISAIDNLSAANLELKPGPVRIRLKSYWPFLVDRREGYPVARFFQSLGTVDAVDAGLRVSVTPVKVTSIGWRDPSHKVSVSLWMFGSSERTVIDSQGLSTLSFTNQMRTIPLNEEAGEIVAFVSRDKKDISVFSRVKSRGGFEIVGGEKDKDGNSQRTQFENHPLPTTFPYEFEAPYLFTDLNDYGRNSEGIQFHVKIEVTDESLEP